MLNVDRPQCRPNPHHRISCIYNNTETHVRYGVLIYPTTVTNARYHRYNWVLRYQAWILYFSGHKNTYEHSL